MIIGNRMKLWTQWQHSADLSYHILKLWDIRSNYTSHHGGNKLSRLIFCPVHCSLALMLQMTAASLHYCQQHKLRVQAATCLPWPPKLSHLLYAWARISLLLGLCSHSHPPSYVWPPQNMVFPESQQWRLAGSPKAKLAEKMSKAVTLNSVSTSSLFKK